MSEENTEEVATEEVATEETTTDEASTEVATVGNVSVEEIVKNAQSMKATGEELVTNYYKFEIGEEMKVLPLGVKRIEKQSPTQADFDNRQEGEDKPMTDAIRFLNCDDGMFYINADAVMVSTLKQHAIHNANEENLDKRYFQCQALKTKKSDKGQYMVFSIQPLS